MRYFELGLGYKEDEGFGTGDYEEQYSIAIKADHHPTFEEAEMFIKKDMEAMGYTGINSITEIAEWECHTFFDDDNIDNWPILTEKESANG